MAEDILSQLWANARNGYGGADQTVIGASLPKQTGGIDISNIAKLIKAGISANATPSTTDTTSGSNSVDMALNGQTVNLGNSSQLDGGNNGNLITQLIQNQGISGYGS